MSDVAEVALTPAATRAGLARSLLLALRPKQWAKNILVGAAPLAAGELLSFSTAGRVLLLFIALSCASSAGYLINDVRDRDYDRAHPRKRLRPIASGALGVPVALAAAAALAFIALALAATCSLQAGMLTGCYLALTLVYSVWLKRVPGVEMVIVSAGFLLRAVIGGVATGTNLSEWFLAVICAASLLVVSGKRVAEMRRLDGAALEPAVAQRGVLHSYSAGYLRAIASMAAGIAVAAYIAWVLLVGMRRGSAMLTAASVAPLTAAVGRYLHVVNAGGGESPEDALLDDKVMLAFGAGWLVLFGASLASAL